MDSVALCFMEGFALVRRANVLDEARYYVSGYRFVGWGWRGGWAGELPLYVGRCTQHGKYVTYPGGFDGKLECPLCLRERLQNSSN